MRGYFARRFHFLDQTYNRVNVLPQNRSFGNVDNTTPPQTFTLVSFGAMTDLTATFRNGDANFEVTADLNQTATGNGGYLATISVRPNLSLPSGTYTDTLVLSGVNQGRSFSINVPINFRIM